MSLSNIEWTDRVWNPLTGCSKVSAGCKNCYAEVMHKRLQSMGQEKYLQPFSQVKIWPDILELPLKWKKPQKIFVNSMSDLFHPDVPFEFIQQVFDVMIRASQHTFQVLTKRPERMVEFFCWIGKQIKDAGLDSVPTRSENLLDYVYWPDNIWKGVSVSTQKDADDNIPELLKLPGYKFLSVEPMLEEIDIMQLDTSDEDGESILFPLAGEFACEGMNEPANLNYGGINWVICGGESGPNARALHPDWVRSLQQQCKEADVPFFFKQWGEWAPGGACIGKKKAGCLIDGKEYKEFPRKREYPF